MKIIDFRFRPNIHSTVQGMIDHPVFGEMHALFKFHERARSQPIEDIVRDMEAQNVVKGVITSRDAETTYGIASGNKGVIPFLEQYPDRFIGMAGLDPHKGMDAVDELGLMVETHGFRGAAIDPFLAKIPANHAKYYPIYAKCCEFDIPVVISTGMATLVDGADPEHCHPRYIDAVARDFPKLKIVVSHGCYPWVNEIIMVVQRNRNVYLELSEYEKAGMSSFRSRSGGICTVNSSRRWNRSPRNLFSRIASSRFSFVAAMIRTSTAVSLTLPTGRITRS